MADRSAPGAVHTSDVHPWGQGTNWIRTSTGPSVSRCVVAREISGGNVPQGWSRHAAIAYVRGSLEIGQSGKRAERRSLISRPSSVVATGEGFGGSFDDAEIRLVLAIVVGASPLVVVGGTAHALSNPANPQLTLPAPSRRTRSRAPRPTPVTSRASGTCPPTTRCGWPTTTATPCGRSTPQPARTRASSAAAPPPPTSRAHRRSAPARRAGRPSRPRSRVTPPPTSATAAPTTSSPSSTTPPATCST